MGIIHILIMLQKINTINFLQFIRFGLAGIIATLCHIGTLIILVEYFEYIPLLASTIGFLLAVIVSYILNHRFTFIVKGNHVLFFSRYLVVCITGLILNTSIMFVTINILKWWYITGQVSTLIIVPIINFMLNKFWAFSIKRDEDFNH